MSDPDDIQSAHAGPTQEPSDPLPSGSGVEPRRHQESGRAQAPDRTIEHGRSSLEERRREHRRHDDDDLSGEEDPNQYELIARAEFHHGPVPDPATLAGYGRIDPTFPERMMRMVELNQEAQLKDRAQITSAETFALRLGMSSMVGLSAISLVLAFILMLNGYAAGASLLALPVLVAAPKLIASIRGTHSERDAPGDD